MIVSNCSWFGWFCDLFMLFISERGPLILLSAQFDLILFSNYMKRIGISSRIGIGIDKI